MTNAAIVTENLAKTFGQVRAVDGLSLRVEQGEIFGLVGPDGAGKTTTMRLLAAIMDPSAGRASVAGLDTVAQAELVKQHIGYMSQRFGLYGDLTVMENLLLYADIYDVPRRELASRIDRLLEFSNLGAFRSRLAGQLSGGMKQKLGLMCSLVHTPKVLLLDEPTNGVDPVSRRDFWRILYQLLREGVTIFISTAYLDEAERCNRLALMHKGRMIACGQVEEIKRLMKGRILEIRTANARQAAQVLRRQLPGQRVALFGDRVHVVIGEEAIVHELHELHKGETIKEEETAKETMYAAGAEIRQVNDMLSQAGLAVLSARVVEPSLEDVFISVVDGRAAT